MSSEDDAPGHGETAADAGAERSDHEEPDAGAERSGRERPDADGARPELDGTLRTRGDQPDEEPDDDVGENIFDGATDRGPIVPGEPKLENAVFVALGVLAGTAVILRLVGAV
jgi:hypothetical protein